MMDSAIHEEEFSDKIDIRLWAKVYGLALPHRKTLAALVTTSILLAAVDGVMFLVPKLVIDRLQASGREASLMTPALMYLGLSTLFCICVAGFIHFAGRIATHVSHDIRKQGFDRLQELSFSYYDKRPAGWLMARMTSDCNKLSRILAWGTLELTWSMCFITAMVAIMLIVEWRLALIVMGVLPPMAILSLYFQRKILRASRQVRKTNSSITASYNEGISGVRTTKTLVRERDNLREFERLTETMRTSAIRSALYSAMFLPLVLTLGSIGTAMALWYGGVDVIETLRLPVGDPDKFTLGSLALFMNISGALIFPIQELAQMFAEFQNARAAAERVVELLETEPEIEDALEVVERIKKVASAPRPDGLAEDGYPDRIETVEFRDVTFEYLPGEPVLREFDLTVRAGQTIALVGPTGGGKSTIVSLLCRFYEPTGGAILINGVDYRSRGLHWLQSNLGIVLQSPHLFSGTVAENIAYGRLDATPGEIRRAAELVNAHEFIQELDNGYDTEVGEGGGRLSTGQKQLISFARAVLADPQLFVMDEATSSVDTETEKLIQEGLHEVLDGRISFVIAHRLSTIREADRILVIEGGRIVEQGDHRELIARRGRYYGLYTNQFAREQEDSVLSGGAE